MHFHRSPQAHGFHVFRSKWLRDAAGYLKRHPQFNGNKGRAVKGRRAAIFGKFEE
jgi:hypothetical protein